MERRTETRVTEPRTEEGILEDVLDGASHPGPEGVFLGALLSVDGPGSGRVQLEGQSEILPAALLTSLSSTDVGSTVAVMFERGDRNRALVLGAVRRAPERNGSEPGGSSNRQAVELDGKSVVLEADKEIVLRCGKSSVTLTQDGRIVLRGDAILSRARGVNRIKGGSIQLN